MSHLLLTLGAGAVLGLAFLRLKVPGGMMVGAMVGVAAFNIGTGWPICPPPPVWQRRSPPVPLSAPL